MQIILLVILLIVITVCALSWCYKPNITGGAETLMLSSPDAKLLRAARKYVKKQPVRFQHIAVAHRDHHEYFHDPALLLKHKNEIASSERDWQRFWKAICTVPVNQVCEPHELADI